MKWTAMRLQTYRDENRSRHFDLLGGGGHPWSIDVATVIASGILPGGLACLSAACGSIDRSRRHCRFCGGLSGGRTPGTPGRLERGRYTPELTRRGGPGPGVAPK